MKKLLALADPFSGPYVGAQIGSDNYKAKVEGSSGLSVDGLSVTGLEGGLFASFDMPLGSPLFVEVEGNALISGAKATLGLGGTTIEAKPRARRSRSSARSRALSTTRSTTSTDHRIATPREGPAGAGHGQAFFGRGPISTGGHGM